MTRGGDTPGLQVVFVCTGNRARSPLAEALFRRYTTGLGTTVTSYGTLDVGPAPALPSAIAAASKLGVDLRGHTAQAVRHARLDSADLVLGFEPSHVADAVIEGGAPPARTFLLGELVALLDRDVSAGDALERAHARLVHADSRRVRTRPDPSAPIVRDPIGEPDAVMSRVADEIDGLVSRLAMGLFEPEGGAVESRATSTRRWWLRS